MKKVLTILVVLALVAGFAFADGNTVTLTTSIDEIAPAFKLYYNDGTDLFDGTKEIEASIAAGFSANFEIYQEGEVGGKDYSNYRSAVVELTVECGAFVLAGDDSYKSGVPSLGAKADGETQKDANNNDTLTYGAIGGSANTVIFKPTYHGKRVDDQMIASFTATWAAAPELPFGDYSADITLTYTANL